MVTHYRFRLYLVALLVLAGFGVLIYRLYDIQVIKHEYYAARVPGSKFESVRIPGIRGEIRDREGRTLVDSTPNYELRLDLREITAAYLKTNGSLPKAPWNRIDRYGLQETKTETDIIKIVEEMVFPGLQELGLLADYSSSAMRVHYRSTRGIVPFTFRRDLSFKEFARFAENNLGIPGVSVARTGQRRYLYDSLACHILGYMNLADIDQVSDEKKGEFNYYVGDDYGVMGVEKTMDHYLQGKAGKLIIEKDEKGKFVGEVSRTDPETGSDVYLTIDGRIQMVMEQSLRKIGRGAAVAIDPRNGDILAIASVPSFNPNVFIPEVSVKDWRRYNEDPTSPMFSRAINPYAPGSTCKIPIALAGCLSDSWKHRFNCGGGAQYGNKFMKCWHTGHGSVDVSTAIKVSCNGFFYRYANNTGIRNIQTMTTLLGMGRKTGIRITGENAGNIPNPEWLRMQGLLWSDAFTALTSIGQGATEATPLQMASVTASLASGGKVYQPRIIKKVAEKNGKMVWEEPPLLKHDLTKEGITAEQVEIVKRGMWRVTNEAGGTAGRARSEMTVLSGKTGTTQTANPKQPTNAWFIAFAPYEEPTIAVCVFVENGNSGGGAASPIAKNIIDNAFTLDQGREMEIVSIPEAIGRNDRIMSVAFNDTDLAAFGQEEESESAVDVAAFVPDSLQTRTYRPMSGSIAQPSIKRTSDSRGRVGSMNSKPKPKFQPFKWLNRKRR
ncbi:penicillin-binding transpeptidase domain-containing protein [Verrucomicrobiales bacterium]|nr:penicillin-binding transpeptidase domain-containing protein [Verrucomicrobiales bacterium]